MTPPVESSRVTVAELGRRLDHIETSNKEAFQGLHRRLDELNYVHPETFALQLRIEATLRENVEARLKDVELDLLARERETKQNRHLAMTGLLFPVITAVVAALVLWAIFGSST